MIITVKDRQSLLDIAIQYLGSVDGVFSLAERNGLGITDRLNDGQQLYYDLSDTVNEKVASYFSAATVSPATDISVNEQINLFQATKIGGIWCKIPARTKATVITNIGSKYDSNTTDVSAVSDTEDIVNATTSNIKKAAAKGSTYISESGETLARLFTDQFNDVFA